MTCLDTRRERAADRDDARRAAPGPAAEAFAGQDAAGEYFRFTRI